MEENRNRKRLKRNSIWHRDDAGSNTGTSQEWARKKARGRQNDAEQEKQDAQWHCGAVSEPLLPFLSDRRRDTAGKTLPPLLTEMDSWEGIAGGMPPWEDALALRDEEHEVMASLFESCQLQGDRNPLKIVRASNQYLFDETDTPYLDCVNSVAHVGHCHPAVVDAVAGTVGSLMNPCGWDFDYGDIKYPKDLQSYLPSNLNTFLFCNSGSEAVDLAVQLARLYTRGNDVLVVDNAFHGSIDSVHHLSPKVSKANNISSVDWVHVVTMPDLYRGPYQADDPLAVKKYVADARDMIDRIRLNGRKISCFIAEPMLTIPGCIIPPDVWLQDMYKMVRDAGGLCIADEVQTGLGRLGSHLWSFEAQGVTPDILIIGKAIGNGYPMACVVTSPDIAALLGSRIKEYKCTAVMNAVGCTVLDVLQRDQLMASATTVGSFLQSELSKLRRKHEYIGDVRGSGLLFGLEVVWNKQSKKPAKEIAEQIVNRMKQENIILANEGDNRNILMIMPPMCFTQENAVLLIEKLDKVLTESHNQRLARDRVTNVPTTSQQAIPGTSDGRLGIIQPQEEEEDDDLIAASREAMDLEYAQHCYHDLD
ncbi:5-phosphohydroxy-L-lysine phospho-lyase-like isoform X2 [Penaeus japonicus]|uniref:5-phosphohydroxy-L-lysine phospho-lyase-like isoform X2 n=1 Tax=Penaeus japonicus TaxID=27405 RepID=UPI001C70D159|nr:5-phosphohydroxy-L-lysine phospho-lyase-like isoform X2 [Penaeus japonicus]